MRVKLVTWTPRVSSIERHGARPVVPLVRALADAFRGRYGGISSSFLGILFACLLLLSWSGDAHARIETAERACDGNSTAIEVRVHGVRNDRGNIMFVLYGDNPDDFLAKGKKILKQRTPAKRGTVAFCVIVPKTGNYAAAVYHDENANGKFDRNWIGLPGEGGGFSNNPTQFLAIPSHSQVAFHVSNSQTRLEIQLRYPTASED